MAKGKRQQEDYFGEQDFIQNGGKVFRGVIHGGFPGGKGRGEQELSQPGVKFRTLEDVAQRGNSLPQMSQRYLDGADGQRSVLLSADERRDLINRQRELASNVRWDTAPARKRIIEQTASNIMVNIQNHLDKVYASSHVQYINRDSAFKQRGGCIFKGHHLPKWAEDDPQKFFSVADKNERANGERYKEIEFALPNCLDLEAQKEIVETFLRHHLKNFYYAYAIHDKIGAMSNGERHPHVHIMFSTREIDDVERRQERPPEKFFARANTKEPEKGGCKKADKFIDKHHFTTFSVGQKNIAQTAPLV